MATWVTPPSANQSKSRSNSRVVVPKVRISLQGRPSGPGTIRQATTVFLCTSRPAQRGYSTSMGSSWDGGAGSRHERESATRASPVGEQQWVVPPGARVKLVDGLTAPVYLDLDARTVPGNSSRCAAYFHPGWCPAGA